MIVFHDDIDAFVKLAEGYALMPGFYVTTNSASKVYVTAMFKAKDFTMHELRTALGSEEDLESLKRAGFTVVKRIVGIPSGAQVNY